MQSVTNTTPTSRNKCHYLLLLAIVSSTLIYSYQAFSQGKLISSIQTKGCFLLSNERQSTPLYMSKDDYPGVARAFNNFKHDIALASDQEPILYTDNIPATNELIIAGTFGKSSVIDELVKNKKIDVAEIKSKWEAFSIQLVENPFPNVKRGLVIIGSDKRGTIYGIYELSKQAGISPWYWWADVPVKKSINLYYNATTTYTDSPVVKYRGIFLNDEEPALGRWAVEKYGGFNHEFYEQLFDLILRLKGNYLWPAMWWASFNSDDPLNPKLADEYGIVMGTTHHEPMMRAHAEWKKVGGEWNYETNEQKLNQFWTEGIQRMNNYESIVTLAMRGDGDKAMTAETNIALLEKIVKNQRDIIHTVTGKDPQQVPQLWALYKEVQDYYDKGMRVPDDVLLLLCDDNWGNIRKLPNVTDPPRKGGYGIYYHFDYVGDPRNYKWLNTNPLPRVWEQMNLAYRYGATQLWLVNVGDLKPIELPTEFFLDYAWNPSKIKAEDTEAYTTSWAKEQFGNEHTNEISVLLRQYAKFNGRRKPELMNSDIYSLSNYKEAETIVHDYEKLSKDAERIYSAMPSNYRDAFYELVLHPIKACANLNRMYFTQARNKLYAKQGRATTNLLADSVSLLFKNDSAYSHYYNKELANGKWNHMMDQTHISYTYWQQPEKDIVPPTEKIVVPVESSLGIALEGSEEWWPSVKTNLSLSEFDVFNKQQHYIDIFNRGKNPFKATITSSASWIKLSSSNISIQAENRIIVSLDWNKVPSGLNSASITVKGANETVDIKINVNNTSVKAKGFIESNKVISMEAVHFTKSINSSTISWQQLPDLGRTLSAVTSIPVTAPSQVPDKNSPYLEYDVFTFTGGDVSISGYFSPTIDFHQQGGLKYGISIDDEAPQIINLHADKSANAWGKSVSDNIIICQSKHIGIKPGKHTIKFWRVDAGVVLQKLIMDLGGLKPSYLGPPESFIQR